MKTGIPQLLIPLLIVCFGLSQNAQALSPPPDGGYPGDNTAEGENALNSLTTGTSNTAIGFHALSNNNTGNANTANGLKALYSNTTGIGNTANGELALQSNSNGGYNTANGLSALYRNTTGTQNMATGAFALFLNTTGDANTASGVSALYSNTTANYNAANGYRALYSNTTGAENTANGARALRSNTTGNYNTANGTSALYNNTTGNYNTANGGVTLYSNTTGIQNTAIGHGTLYYNTTGSGNIALGFQAGQDLTTGNYNIDIGNQGFAGDAHIIRIGDEAVQNACYVAGISGQTISGGGAVYVDANGRLGTSTSSARFKDDIKSMDRASEAILGLKPVTFRYKKEIDSKGIPQFGLIAEEVAKVNPALVVRDKDGKPYTVRYDAVNAMLLNEFLKEHRNNEEQEKTIAELKSGMTALAATVKEQASQIQKVSEQLEASKPAPQVVNNP